MNERWRQQFEIVPYEPRYRQAVRDVCAATAWQGGPAPEVIVDEWMWAEVWTRYFTDREPRHTWLVRQRGSGQIVGYLTGTMNIRNVDRFAPWLLPGIVYRVIRRRLLRNPETRRALLGMARAQFGGELELPAWVREHYPAAWHFNLLPTARGSGIGRALFELFLAQVREHGVAGIHAQTLSNNEGVARFNRSAGFRVVSVQPTTCFAHAFDQKLAVHTWVREVCTGMNVRPRGRG